MALLDDPADPSNATESVNPESVDSSVSLSDPSNPSSYPESKFPLRSINVVDAFVPFIEESRRKVTSEMENMVLTGLATLVRFHVSLSVLWALNPN